MAKQLKPMLAAKCSDVSSLRFPVVGSPKLDGVRAIVIGGVVMSRSLKPIPNAEVQRRFGHAEGYDGELIVGSPTAPDVFRQTTSGVMSQDGEPDVQFWVFDKASDVSIPWWTRTPSVSHDPNIIIVEQVKLHTSDEVAEYEERCLLQGYEGIMLRDPDAPYKFGRSTEREGALLKVKRFSDSEATVLFMEERMHNANESRTNALGRTERSSHKANLVPTGTMGALVVRDIVTGVEFNVGTGFDDAERARWWAMGTGAVGRTIKYRHFPSGGKDKPRFPIYVGERHPNDMGE